MGGANEHKIDTLSVAFVLIRWKIFWTDLMTHKIDDLVIRVPEFRSVV